MPTYVKKMFVIPFVALGYLAGWALYGFLSGLALGGADADQFSDEWSEE